LSDIIKLLPDAVANQIAAGEVVQRPASAVKELLENSLDAGATQIRLIIKDGGSGLIQVIDNGKGMSETDARMCWERHATSKIKTANDLFALNTFGFRGEALASIAAVAQVEMKTRREQDDTAVYIRIEGSEVLEQSITAAPVGTSIAIKNLFYNIPARRNFLKSATVETRHIIEEFQRQALAHPQIAFSMFNNGADVYDLKPATLQQRIADVLGSKKQEELLALQEETELVTLAGFVGSPALAKRTRGEQYLFVNGRFIRSAYFNHAIQSAYEGLAEEGSHALFVLFMHIDPARIDVNVHPTKTEVKFEDEKHIYNIIKAAVRKVLGSFVVQPDMDIFGGMEGIEAFFNQPALGKTEMENHPYLKPPAKTNYNPFSSDDTGYNRNANRDWQRILGSLDQSDTITTGSRQMPEPGLLPVNPEQPEVEEVFRVQAGFLAAKIGGELYIVDQRAAHVKLLYHDFLQALEKNAGQTQQLLFPCTLELNQAKLATALDMLEDLKSLGFDVSHFGGNTLIINGVPAELGKGNEAKTIETLIEDFIQTQGDMRMKRHESLALSMARQAAVNTQEVMSREAMQQLIARLFLLPEKQYGPDKRPVFMKFAAEYLFELFRKGKF
jgi:DNA mismatch repair protein MutL